jgi:hypothetical protein
MDTVHKIDGFRKPEIVHQKDVYCSGTAQDKDEPHDPNHGRHDHGDDREVRKKIPAREFISKQKKGDGDAQDRSCDHGPCAEEKRVHQTFEIEGVREKIIEVIQRENALIRREGIVKEPDERVDQK